MNFPTLDNHEILNYGVLKFRFDKSGVEMSFKLLERGYFNPRMFNPELFNPMVQKFMVAKSGVEKLMVEKSGVERSGVEAWG